MYMNCAVVTITGRATGVLDGPGVFVANVGNGCATGEGADVVFPDPGSDIVYGGNAGKRAPPTGNCGAGKTVIAGGGAAGSGAGGGPTTGGENSGGNQGSSGQGCSYWRSQGYVCSSAHPGTSGVKAWWTAVTAVMGMLLL